MGDQIVDKTIKVDKAVNRRESRNERSRFYARIAVDALPERIIQMLEKDAGTLIHYSCSEGSGTAYISARFPALSVTGIDFSEEAVENAKNHYPKFGSELGDVTSDRKEADIVFASNIPERTEDRKATLERLVKSARKAAIVLLPIGDADSEDAEQVSQTAFFPQKIEGYDLTYFRIIDCRENPESSQPEKLILLIFVSASENAELSIDELYREWLGKLIDQSYLFKQELNQQQERNNEIISNYIRKKNEETISALNYIKTVSNSVPYQLAHYSLEVAHAFFGKKEDRILGKNYLFKSRRTITRYNYMEEMRSTVRRIGDCSTLRQQIPDSRAQRVIRQTIQDYAGSDVYVMPALIDWNVPLFQRPQQLAMGLAHNGMLFFYLTGNTYYDQIDGAEFLEDNLVLTKKEMLHFIMDTARAEGKRIILDMYSTGNTYGEDWLQQWEQYPYRVLYEYVDEISEEISRELIPESAMKRHNALLEDKNVYMVATAEKLYNEVITRRGNQNVLFSGNGVDLKHFQQEIDRTLIPENLRSVLKNDRPVIGYFGAIAIWFDYDLILEAAVKRPDYLFLMIGPQYDDHHRRTRANVRRLRKQKNIIFTGTIDYKILPHLANGFTVATIPFLINDITESTSPIKLYEYMAMGKPIVTTAMPECMKHPEVMIARDTKEYVRLLDQAVSIANGPDYPAYREKLIHVAEQNSWDEKAREIIHLTGGDGNKNA